jgi:hypothetical protein
MNHSGGFIYDDPKELVPSRRRPPVFATNSNGNDQEDIEAYVESLKKKAQEYNHIGGSNTQDKLRPPQQLWMLHVPVLSFHVLIIG